ncbi:mannosyl (alpha-1,3-)-glycoprotein beta-1,2-N-acetylglucosaminyltransferase [Homalodisca vitripennis]|nr:mannosyl (alpha-1,3-)-glycoprotein beta-1,2-N-acetylglucosaminyltransferase [Homalodisca vitripennis]
MSTVEVSHPHQALTPQTKDKLTKLESEILSEKKYIQLLIKKLESFIQTHWDEKTLHENLQNAFDENPMEAIEIQKREVEQISGQPAEVIAVLVLACNRVTVTRCLDQLIKYRANSRLFPIIVSQDCQHEPTARAIQGYGDQVYHIQQPDQSDIQVPPNEEEFKGYFQIARHYRWALNQMFNTYNFSTVLIIEDDLDVSPDIYEYFLGTLPLLQADPTLWCVSAWNDNGKISLVNKTAHDTVYRTDFFPGLGWMLTKSLWVELSVKWPAGYWDDWLRLPQQRKNRACIRPEISRTKTFGEIGVSNGLFYEEYLKFIHLNDQFVPFTKKNLTFLLKDNYDVQFVRSVYKSRVISYQELKTGSIFFDGPVRIRYSTNYEYWRAAKTLGLMEDFKSGVPRTSYRGIVTFFYNKRRVYLAPYANWKEYDVT